MRLVRVVKSLRAIRMVRTLRLFRGLNLLVKACQFLGQRVSRRRAYAEFFRKKRIRARKKQSHAWTAQVLPAVLGMVNGVAGCLGFHVHDCVTLSDAPGRKFLQRFSWSCVLKVVFMSMGTLVMGNLLRDFITDKDANMDDRLWIYSRYGTAYHAMYTLYEITFAGTRCARTLLRNVSSTHV